MAQIDTTGIEGFDSMDADQLRDFIKGFSYDDGADALAAAQAESRKMKESFDKASSEAAGYKKQLRAVQDSLSAANQAAESAREEGAKQVSETQSAYEAQLKELQEQMSALTREKTIAAYKANFLAQGYADDLAASSAVAMADGDSDTLFANSAKFIEAHDAAVKANAANRPVKPATGNENPDRTAGKTRAEIRRMSPTERARFYAEHPDEYRKAYQS